MNNLTIVSANDGNLRMDAETILKNRASSKSLMSRRNLLKIACFVFLAAGFILSGCKKDDKTSTTEFEDGKLTVTMDDDGYKVAKIVTYATAWGENSQVEYDVEFLSTPFSNGGFTLNFPDPPATKFLFPVSSFGSSITMEYEGATPKFTQVETFKGFDGANKYVCELAYGIWDKAVYIYFWYVDKNVTITGSNDHTTFELSLKPGWNMVFVKYEQPSGNAKFSTTPISGAEWWFYEFG